MKQKKSKCFGCRYWRLVCSAATGYACHYCYDTGHSRGCKAEECNKREAKK